MMTGSLARSAFWVFLGLGATGLQPRVISTLKLNNEVYRPGDVPTMCFTSTGLPRLALPSSDRVEAFACFSTMQGALGTSPFPPYLLARISGPTSIEILLDEITCNTNEQFIQAEIRDRNGQVIEVTNEVHLRIDKTSCPPNEPGSEGCSVEFWKDPLHFGDWPIPLLPGNRFGDIFDDAFPGLTLIEVLKLKDGSLNNLGRETVAALLNGWSPFVDYDISELDVIQMFDQTFPGTEAEYDALAASLAALNAQVCPLADSVGGGGLRR